MRHVRPSVLPPLRASGARPLAGGCSAQGGVCRHTLRGAHSAASSPAAAAGSGAPRAAAPREYFYWVDLRGHLYCIDKDATTLPRQNDPAFLRDGRFLDFFWRQLQHNSPAGPGRGRYQPQYPYVSPCGRELNYVRAADRPIAFHSLQALPSGCSVLLYAHDLSVPFDPTGTSRSGSASTEHLASAN